VDDNLQQETARIIIIYLGAADDIGYF